MKLIPLTKGHFAKVNNSDFKFLNQWKWHAKVSTPKHIYAARWQKIGRKWSQVLMHHVVLKLPRSARVDHRDRDTLNNSKRNLRRATKEQNAQNSGIRKTNTSGFKGVVRFRNKWRAQITRISGQAHIGLFTSVRKAAEAYDRQAELRFGEFAVTNKTLGLL